MKYSNMIRRLLSHRLLSLTIEPRQLSRRYKADLKNRNLTFESRTSSLKLDQNVGIENQLQPLLLLMNIFGEI